VMHGIEINCAGKGISCVAAGSRDRFSITLVCTVQDLVFNGEREESYEHLGIGYLAANLRKKGFLVHVLYCRESESNMDIVDRILQNSPILLGFNAYEVTIRKVLSICEIIKEKMSEIHICLGGETPTFHDKRILHECLSVDSIVRGEGELTLFELSRAIEKKGFLKEIKGLSYRANGQIIVNPDRELIRSLDGLPWPDRDLCKEIKLSVLAIETSRGCLGRCTFCTESHPRLYGSTWRGRSVKMVVDEIEHLVNDYQISRFNILDASFEDPGEIGKKRVTEFAKEVITRNLNIGFMVNFRSESITEKDLPLLDLLIRAGLEGVVLGLESGCNQTLRLYNKQATVADNERIVQILHSKHLGFMHNMIMFQPYSTFDELRENVDFLRRCSLAHRFEDFQTHLLLHPGMALKERMIKDGLISPDFSIHGEIECRYEDERILPFARAMGNIIPETNLEFEFFDIGLDIFYLRLRKLSPSEEVLQYIEKSEEELGSIRKNLSDSNYRFFLIQLQRAEDGSWDEKTFKKLLRRDIVQTIEKAKWKMRGVQKRIIKELRSKGIEFCDIAR
jgi:radical SAM superfamily enzyme YgiQ (UPF0313 family)